MPTETPAVNGYARTEIASINAHLSHLHESMAEVKADVKELREIVGRLADKVADLQGSGRQGNADRAWVMSLLAVLVAAVALVLKG